MLDGRIPLIIPPASPSTLWQISKVLSRLIARLEHGEYTLRVQDDLLGAPSLGVRAEVVFVTLWLFSGHSAGDPVAKPPTRSHQAATQGLGARLARPPGSASRRPGGGRNERGPGRPAQGLRSE